jgi:HK97 family phage portal protein
MKTKAKVKTKPNATKATVTAYSALWMRGIEPDEPFILNPASNLWLVFKCVQLKANKICSVPFRVDDENGNPVEDPIILNRVQNPNPYQSWHDFIVQSVLNFDVFGAFAWFVQRDGQGQVVNVFPLVPARMKPIIKQNEIGFAYISGWQYMRPDSTQVLLQASDVVYVPQHDPYGGLIGRSSLDMAKHILHARYAAEELNSWSLRNHAVPPGIIELPEGISDAQREQFKTKLREEWRGHKQAQIPNLLPAGAKYISISPTFAELEFIDGLKLLRDDICALMGVPVREIFPQESGLNSGISAEEDAKKFWRNGLFPIMSRIEMAWQRAVMDSFAPSAKSSSTVKNIPAIKQRQLDRKALHGAYIQDSASGIYGWFEVHKIDVFFAERLSRIKEAAAAVQSSLASPNEAITAFDLPFSTDDPAGNVRLISFNVMPLSSIAIPTETTNEKSEKAENVFGAMANDANQLKESLRQLFIRAELRQTEEAQKAANKAKRERFVNLARQAQAKAVKSGADKLSSYFFSQRKRVLSALNQIGKEKLVEMREKSGKATLTLEPFGATPSEAQKLVAIIKSLLSSGLSLGNQTVNQMVGREIVLAGNLLDKLFDARSFVANSINEATTSQLNTQWEEWLKSNEPAEQLFERIRGVFGNAQKTSEGGRSFEIALTETGVGLNTGIAEAAKLAGAPLKSWQSMGDGEAHAKADNDYQNGIPWNDPFIVDGEALMHPRDAGGSAANVVNCRCVVVPIFP